MKKNKIKQTNEHDKKKGQKNEVQKKKKTKTNEGN